MPSDDHHPAPPETPQATRTPHPSPTPPHTEALTRLCPPPDNGPARSINWSAVERELGLALPADYKQLVETYGGGLFADTLRLLEPDGPDDMYDLVAQTEEREEILNEGRGPLREAHPVPCGRFLLDVLTGTTTSTYFCDLDESVAPQDRYRFRPNSRIFGG